MLEHIQEYEKLQELRAEAVGEAQNLVKKFDAELAALCKKAVKDWKKHSEPQHFHHKGTVYKVVRHKDGSGSIESVCHAKHLE